MIDDEKFLGDVLILLKSIKNQNYIIARLGPLSHWDKTRPVIFAPQSTLVAFINLQLSWMDIELEMTIIKSMPIGVGVALIVLLTFTWWRIYPYTYHRNFPVWYICGSTRTIVAFCKHLNKLDLLPWNFGYKIQYLFISFTLFRDHTTGYRYSISIRTETSHPLI